MLSSVAQDPYISAADLYDDLYTLSLSVEMEP